MFTASGVGRRAEPDGGVSPFGSGYMIVRSRLRITQDGGHSLLAVSDKNTASTNAADSRAKNSTSSPYPPDMSMLHLGSPPCPAASPPPEDSRQSDPTGLQTPSSARSSADATFTPPAPPARKPLDSKDKDSAVIKALVGHLKKESTAGRPEITFKKAKQFLSTIPCAQTTSKAKVFLKAERLGWVKVREQGPTRYLSVV